MRLFRYFVLKILRMFRNILILLFVVWLLVRLPIILFRFPPKYYLVYFPYICELWFTEECKLMLIRINEIAYHWRIPEDFMLWEWIVHLCVYFKNMLTFDFGPCFTPCPERPLINVISSYLLRTIVYLVPGLIIAMIFGLHINPRKININSSTRKNSKLELYRLVYVVPIFISALLLKFFSFAIITMLSIEVTETLLNLLNVLYNIVIPIFLVSLVYFSGSRLIIEQHIGDILSSDYVRFAYAKGLSTEKIVKEYIKPNLFARIKEHMYFLFLSMWPFVILIEIALGIPGFGYLFVWYWGMYHVIIHGEVVFYVMVLFTYIAMLIVDFIITILSQKQLQ